jgi:hypothetical protein
MNTNWQAIAAVISAIGILMSATTAFFVWRETTKQTRRRDLIPVWKEMLVLSRINSNDPNPEDVRMALNLLGLVAQCYMLEIVDRYILTEMFRSVFVSVYDDIKAIDKQITVGSTTQPGRDFLKDVANVGKLYQQWSAN